MSLTDLATPLRDVQPSSNGSRTLYVPDLFAGILSGDPKRNPFEVEVARQSEEWTKQYVGNTFRPAHNIANCNRLVKMDARTGKILTKANFAYLISLSAPDADEEAFRMAVDWCIWVGCVP